MSGDEVPGNEWALRPLVTSLATGFAAAAAVALLLFHTGEVSERADAALARGMPAREAELARGFVLGHDEGVDAATVESFRRAGLSHLLSWSQAARTTT